MDLMTSAGRWLAYADFCINNQEQLARCQPFWNFVAVVLGLFSVAAVTGVIVKMIRDRRRGSGGYRKPM